MVLKLLIAKRRTKKSIKVNLSPLHFCFRSNSGKNKMKNLVKNEKL